MKAALLISGLYDLLPVRLSARNEYVRLDERLEDEYSPIRHVDRIRCPVTVAWAEKEGAEFTRQSKEFAAALESRAARAIVGEGPQSLRNRRNPGRSGLPAGPRRA